MKREADRRVDRSFGGRPRADAQRAAHEACGEEITWNMRQWAAAHAKLGKKAYT